jgi:hypothetical protein
MGIDRFEAETETPQQQAVGVHKTTNLPAQCRPVFDLLSGAAMVPGTCLGSALHQLLLQTHRGWGFRHNPARQ